MKVLGIGDGMTGGAALIEGGHILYAVHEERLIRAKMATGFPRESIDKTLADTRTKPEEIDAIAVATVNEFFREEAIAYDGWLLREQAPLKEALLNASSIVNQVFGATPLLRKSYYDLKALLGRMRRKAIDDHLRREWGFACPIKFIDHHFAHACSAYFTSGLRAATVITMDGAGDNSSSRVYAVRDGHFRMLCNVDSFNSIWNYYAYITHICGFKAQKHEGKITGLAAYGEPAYVDILKRFIAYKDGTTVNRGRVFYWAAVKAIEKALPKSFKREDLAASMQQVLEDVCSAYYTLVNFYLRRLGLLRGFSIESRLPLLDYRLVEYAAKIPSRMKIRGVSDTKYIYKKILEGVLPREILYDRPKLGHSVPMKNWLREDATLQKWVEEILSESSIVTRGFFRYSVVRRFVDEHLSRRHNHSHRLWGLVVLELWLRAWVGPASPVGARTGH